MRIITFPLTFLFFLHLSFSQDIVDTDFCGTSSKMNSVYAKIATQNLSKSPQSEFSLIAAINTFQDPNHLFPFKSIATL